MHRSTITRPLHLAIALFLALSATTAHAVTQQQLSLGVGGIQREYILAAPTFPAVGPRPLIVVLHGHLGTAANALGAGRLPSPLSAWLDIVDREHPLVVALQGLKGGDNHTGWHDCRLDATENPNADDVAFVESVVNNLVQVGRADPHRIYIMGMSNGGMMAYRLALQMQPAPAAIAAVSAGMAAQNACGGPSRPVSMLLIHGTDDPVVPYDGGKTGLKGYKTGTVIGAAVTRDYWLRADGLANTPPVSYSFPHLSSSDPTSASKLTWGPAGGPQVEVVTIQNGGHVEPSLAYHYGWLYRQLVGNQNQDLESAEEAWSFFKDKTSK